ncbi:MAG: ATP-binding protein [Caulobacter sp.]
MTASRHTQMRILRWRDEGRRGRLIQLAILTALIWFHSPSLLIPPWAVLTAAAIWLDAELSRRARGEAGGRLVEWTRYSRVVSGTLFASCSLLLLLDGSLFGLAGAIFISSANIVSNAVMNRGSSRDTLLMLGPSTAVLLLIPLVGLFTGSIGSGRDALLLVGGGLLYTAFVAGVVRALAGEAAAYEAAVAEAQAAAAAREVFLANMSHEIRTPLNGVVGVAQALSQTPLTPAQQEMVGLIGGSGRVLERLLSDVLDSAKIEAGAFALESGVFNLRDEIEAAALLMRDRAADKGVDFSLTFAPEADGCFTGDAVRLRQIVANLASNAVKFTEAGGVRLKVEIDDGGGESRLLLTVEDDGIGFDDETGERLFQPFIQADASITRRFGGSGLGLSISRALAEAMGGGLSARSTPGVGSRFLLNVPLPRAAVERVEAAPEQAELSDRLRVLLAEDHPTNQKVVQLFLEPHGIEVVVAENGQIALDLWRGGGFDVVLMDMQMPVMDGVAAVGRIRAVEEAEGLPRTPIAMLTANALAEHRAAAIAAGADGHIAKPITPASLMEGLVAVLSAGAVADQVREAS